MYGDERYIATSIGLKSCNTATQHESPDTWEGPLLVAVRFVVPASGLELSNPDSMTSVGAGADYGLLFGQLTSGRRRRCHRPGRGAAA